MRPHYTGELRGHADEIRIRSVRAKVEKTGPNGTTVYVYDNVIGEQDGSGNPTATFTQGFGIDEPLAIYSGGASYYYQADGLDSITSLSDTTGKAAQTYTYDSFGNLTAATGTVSNPFQYTAREFDSETGLYYYRARYYDPATGRFLSEDPMRFASDANFYRYVADSPINFADPLGLYWVYCMNSGALYHVDPRSPGAPSSYIGSGYAGNGPGLNNPGMEDVQNVGPLPEHIYRIGPQHTIVTNVGITLKGAMRLTPVNIPRQSRGLYDVSRSKRLDGVANATPVSGGHLNGVKRHFVWKRKPIERGDENSSDIPWSGPRKPGSDRLRFRRPSLPWLASFV